MRSEGSSGRMERRRSSRSRIGGRRTEEPTSRASLVTWEGGRELEGELGREREGGRKEEREDKWKRESGGEKRRRTGGRKEEWGEKRRRTGGRKEEWGGREGGRLNNYQ